MITNIQLVIFDMDGLMFDTEKVSFLSFKKAIALYGFALDTVTFNKTIGINIKKVKEVYLEKFGKDLPFDEMLEHKFTFAAEYIHRNGVPIKQGLYELVNFLTSKRIKTAVATSSNRIVAMDLLNMAGLSKKFDYILCGDEIKHSKPNPEIFLKTANMLNCDPHKCLVLEDSEKGIAAASRAEMIAIMIPDLIAPNEVVIQKAFKIMSSLSDVKQYLENDLYV